MSDAKPPEEAAAEGGAPAGGGASKLPVIALGVSTLGTAIALGMLVYTKMIFKRPAITESAERVRVKSMKDAKPKAEDTEKAYVQFAPMTLNISPDLSDYTGPDGVKAQRIEKLHYAKINFVFEVTDVNRQGEIEGMKAQFTDKLIQHLGNKTFEELTTIQGRYLLRTEVSEIMNELLKEPLVSTIFFNQLTVE